MSTGLSHSRNLRGRLDRLRNSAEAQLLFVVVWRSSPLLALLWWLCIVVRGLMPVVFAYAVGSLVTSVSAGTGTTASLTLVAGAFAVMQVAGPFHAQVGANLGLRVREWLHDKLAVAAVRPDGIAPLERSEVLDDLSLAREFDLGMTGPTLADCMPAIGNSFVLIGSGALAAIGIAHGFSWWIGIVVAAAWLSPHVLMRSGAAWRSWKSDEVAEHQRHADYTYRLAVNPSAAKEVRLFGLPDWLVARFLKRRRALLEISVEAIRLRERPLALTIVALVGANVLFLGLLMRAGLSGRLSLGEVVSMVTLGMVASSLGTMDFSWWLHTAAKPVPVIVGLEKTMVEIGRLAAPPQAVEPPSRGGDIAFSGVAFSYNQGAPVFDELDFTIPQGQCTAIVGQNGAGKTTLVKLLCRLYDPGEGRVSIGGTDLRDIGLTSWHQQIAVVFQDFVRYELSLRENVTMAEDATDPAILAALAAAGADDVAELDTVLTRRAENGTDLSGGQWQRVALARALYAVSAGAGIVILDEPTAHLDVRAELEIFDRLIDLTRGRTTILVSHRFSTVRRADNICVMEGGRMIEQGSHDQLMALDGRYSEMYKLQAFRFSEESSESSS
ncbi:ABC transporter ATP-binding protein [Kribbella monticola]|uniref:ABC transporter ATP-binding protein n=1 Tax=Kribbella monticola TaxID=2185285 RepID=UPI000DD35389|nr:ABC transporter ATP-binding protein [Kribbella monticola]